jgi:hypothetical protein
MGRIEETVAQRPLGHQQTPAKPVELHRVHDEPSQGHKCGIWRRLHCRRIRALGKIFRTAGDRASGAQAECDYRKLYYFGHQSVPIRLSTRSLSARASHVIRRVGGRHSSCSDVLIPSATTQRWRTSVDGLDFSQGRQITHKLAIWPTYGFFVTVVAKDSICWSKTP